MFGLICKNPRGKLLSIFLRSETECLLTVSVIYICDSRQFHKSVFLGLSLSAAFMAILLHIYKSPSVWNLWYFQDIFNTKLVTMLLTQEQMRNVHKILITPCSVQPPGPFNFVLKHWGKWKRRFLRYLQEKVLRSLTDQDRIDLLMFLIGKHLKVAYVVHYYCNVEAFLVWI